MRPPLLRGGLGLAGRGPERAVPVGAVTRHGVWCSDRRGATRGLTSAGLVRSSQTLWGCFLFVTRRGGLVSCWRGAGKGPTSAGLVRSSQTLWGVFSFSSHDTESGAVTGVGPQKDLQARSLSGRLKHFAGVSFSSQDAGSRELLARGPEKDKQARGLSGRLKHFGGVFLFVTRRGVS